jgi:integrase/recombinase XerD
VKNNRSGQAEPLTKDEFWQVCEALQSPHHRLIFALCWFTTERPGAILKLSVNNVYEKPGKPRRQIVIPAWSRKDRATREVPVSRKLRSLLSQYKHPTAGWLFPSPLDQEKQLSFSAYQKALTRAFNNLGFSGYTTYSTRRGSITHLSRQGLSARVLQVITGHKSLSSLQRYIDVSPAEREAAIALL